MKTDDLYQRIKAKCAERNLTISQLEKELNFGTGTIGKWIQSSPSLEKVMKVAGYFHWSMDEICGLKTNGQERLIEKLIHKTEEGMAWREIGFLQAFKRQFLELNAEEKEAEAYFSEYDGLKFLIICEKTQNRLELYVSCGQASWKKRAAHSESFEVLYEKIQKQEQEYENIIDEKIENFLNS